VGYSYASREDVKRALDSAETARNDTQIDRALAASTGAVEGLLHRRFVPITATRYFDWPRPYARSWRLWLDQHELISATTVTAGGAAIADSDYLLRPYDGPPYTHVEIDLASSAAFAALPATHQQAVAITGVYGHSAEEASAGALAEVLDASETGVDLNSSAAAAIGVGHIIKVDSERMIVTGKTMLDSGQNLTSTSLTASAADVSVTVADGTGFAIGETILIDSERMLVVDIAGNRLVVKRAWDGTVLAAHTHTTADIYALRTLTVTRGALGTTAATHSTSAAIARHVVPGLVNALAVAEAMNVLLNEGSGYARTAGQGENAREYWGRQLGMLREQAYTAFGRKARLRAA
jgi:hypothetical protein